MEIGPNPGLILCLESRIVWKVLNFKTEFGFTAHNQCGSVSTVGLDWGSVSAAGGLTAVYENTRRLSSINPLSQYYTFLTKVREFMNCLGFRFES